MQIISRTCRQYGDIETIRRNAKIGLMPPAGWGVLGLYIEATFYTTARPIQYVKASFAVSQELRPYRPQYLHLPHINPHRPNNYCSSTD